MKISEVQVLPCIFLWMALATTQTFAQDRTKISLSEIQKQILSVLPSIEKTVVSIEAGGGSGSGVIVSADGLVLTAAHVIDKADKLTVIYPDGRRFPGKALGTYGPADAGMVQILEGAPHPFADVAPGDSLVKNQTVIAMGHPGGFDLDRGPPLRIGHITDLEENFITVDTALIGGDSGGPSFDLLGRVIGIHSHISGQVEVNRDGNITAFLGAWESMKEGKHDPVHFSQAVKPSQRESKPLAPKLDSVTDPSIAGDSESRDSRLKQLAEEAKSGGGKLKLNREELLQLRRQLAQRTDALAPTSGSRLSDLWSADWNREFSVHCDRLKDSVHRVFVSGRQTALAMAVTADGMLITKASEIKGRTFTVELAPNNNAAGESIAVDDALDLALIRVGGHALRPVDFKSKDVQGAKGTLCAAIGTSSEPAGFGILSCRNRPLNGKSGAYLGLTVLPHDEGLKIAEIKPNSPTIRAGLRSTDIIQAIDGEKVGNAEQLNERIASGVPGETIRMEVKREDALLTLAVELGDGKKLAPMPGNREQALDSITAKLSKRRWFFSTGLQHDCSIAAKDCGGPLVDLEGRLIGLNIARAGRIHSYAIPIDDVIGFVSKHVTNEGLR